MTLFEIAIALALVAVSITSVALLFPAGIRAQSAARFQLYAAAKAVELVDTFATTATVRPQVDGEAPVPWQVPLAYGAHLNDLERRVSSYRTGVFPLPQTIARRLDSDGDEIARLLDDGGRLSYSQALATTGMKDDAVPSSPPNEAQRLVFAVVGCAQLDAMPVFPWKAWPYYAAFPSPPAHGGHWNSPGFALEASPLPCDGVFAWEHTADPDIAAVVATDVAGVIHGYADYVQRLDRDAALRYCQAALWYAARKGLPVELYDGTTAIIDFMPGHEPWRQVQALRFVAHAATCLTRWHTRVALDGGVPIAPLTHDGTTSLPVTWTTGRIQAVHESCLTLATAFAARFPYDWRAPRPANRMIFLDHPLLQWDPFAPTLTGRITGTAIDAEQWRPVAARDIVGIGRSFSYMDDAIPSTRPAWRWWRGAPGESLWGDTARFTLADRFAACERARELVFWSVDWQSYVDAETAPSAPVDASRYPLSTPDRAGMTLPWAMEMTPFRDWRQFAFRNPEKTLVFTETVAHLPDGAPVEALRLGTQQWLDEAPGRRDQGRTPQAKAIFSGIHGADRNCNGRLDRGPVPASTRLRASSVARFNVYDPRLPLTLR